MRSLDMAGAQYMTPADLRDWQANMGLTQQGAADALGVSLPTFKRYLVGQVPKCIALACAALAAGLPEWSPKK